MLMIRMTVILLTASFLATNYAQAAEVVVEGLLKSVDADSRTLAIAVDGEVKTLDVSRKATVSIDGDDAALASLMAGDNVKLSYHDELEIVLTIEAKPPSKDKGQSYDIVNLSELNSQSSELCPCLSPDGLTIYWSVASENSEFWIWTARRKNTESPFREQERLLKGFAPVVSEDGLEMIMKPSKKTGLWVSTRKTADDAFSRPQPIRDFKVHSSVIPRCLSPDGTTLYFETEKSGEFDDFSIAVTERADRRSPWQKPKKVVFAQRKLPQGVQIANPFVTTDGLHLYCVLLQRGSYSSLARWSRSRVDAPFATLQFIDLEPYVVARPDWLWYICLYPTYVPTTGELFVSSSSFFSTEDAAGSRRADLWAIEGIRHPDDEE